MFSLLESGDVIMLPVYQYVADVECPARHVRIAPLNMCV